MLGLRSSLLKLAPFPLPPHHHPSFSTRSTRASVKMAFQSNKPIILYTLDTPNGVVAGIFLEELKVRRPEPLENVQHS